MKIVLKIIKLYGFKGVYLRLINLMGKNGKVILIKNHCFIAKSYFLRILVNLSSLVIKHDSNIFFFQKIKVVTYFSSYFPINFFKKVLLMAINDNFPIQI